MPRLLCGLVSVAVLLGLGACDGAAPADRPVAVPATRSPPEMPGSPDEKGFSTKPNIVFIVIDTARADHFSSYGYALPTTPHLDALAADGVRYSRAHSVAPWTLPSHMSMFTGLLPAEHGATWRAYNRDADSSLAELAQRSLGIREPERLLGPRLHGLGYQTLGFSANPWVGRRTGMALGFEEFAETWRPRRDFDAFYATLPDEIKTERRYDEDRSGMAVLLFKWLLGQKRDARPFFAFFNFMDAHYAYVPPPPFDSQFGGRASVGRRLAGAADDASELALLGGKPAFTAAELIPFYDAGLHYADFQIGGLLRWLEARDLYDDALIVVTSDHGEQLGEEGRFSHQLSLSEELLHVPLIVKYPRGRAAGTVVDDEPVSNLDVHRTILAAAGDPAGTQRKGSLLRSRDLAAGPESGRDLLLAESYFARAYLREVKRAHPPFLVAPHRVVRRAVYTRGDKTLLTGLVPSAAASGLGETRLPAGVRDRVQRFAQGHPRRGIVTLVPAPRDADLVEQLESLGYIEAAD